MKKIALGLTIMAASALIALGGESYSGKEAKEVVPPPCPEWYGDTEWNVGIWGTYVFTGNDWFDDEYLETDHAWGGGVDLKYFFHRYFGVGVEGWIVDARRQTFDLTIDTPNEVFDFTEGTKSRAVGAALGTITFRYPFHCSRFSPYVWGGAGAIFGGGDIDRVVTDSIDPLIVHTEHTGRQTEFIGQVGGGIEVRFTRHIGWINDFSWNFVGKDNSDFGMVRSGINFAF